MCSKKYYNNIFLLLLITVTLILVSCHIKKENEIIKPTEIETTIKVIETTHQEQTTSQKEIVYQTTEQIMVWISKTGKRYHSTPDCSNMKQPLQVTLMKQK